MISELSIGNLILSDSNLISCDKMAKIGVFVVTIVIIFMIYIKVSLYARNLEKFPENAKMVTIVTIGENVDYKNRREKIRDERSVS